MPAAASPEPAPNPARVLAAAVRGRWRRAADELARTVQQGGTASVHDLRVALRRLLATLAVAGELEAPAPRKIVRRLERALASLSPIRDLEVQKQTLTAMAEHEPLLAGVVTELDTRRAELAGEVTDRLARFAAGETSRALAATAEALDAAADAPQATKQLALGAVARCYAKFDRRRRAVANADRHELHRVRLAFKRYRYAVEVALPLLPPSAERALVAMKHFQDELGALQDASVLVATISRFPLFRRRKGSPRARALLDALKRDRDRRVHGVRAALAAQVAATPPAFSEIFG